MRNMKKYIIAIGAFILVTIVMVFWPFALIDAGHRGVVTQFGEVKTEILQEGFHFINPMWTVHEYDVRTQKNVTQANAASKDLQSVSTTIALNYHINPDFVRELFQETQGEYDSTLIAPAVQESVKAATANFTAEELITKRSEVKQAMIESLSSRKSMRFFLVEDVSIVDFSFSESFNTAIENKVRAEQDALASKNKLEQIKYEAEQKVVTATAEAESLRIQAEALASNSSLVSLEAVRKWNGVLPTYVLGDSIPFLNIIK